MRLRTKLTITLALITLIPMSIVVIFAKRIVSERFDNSFQQEVKRGLVTIRVECDEVKKDLFKKLKSLSKERELKRILLLKERKRKLDQFQVFETVERLMIEGGLDLLTFYTKDGFVLARGHEVGRFGDVLKIGQREGIKISPIILRGKECLAVMAWHPILHRGHIIGGLKGGYLLGGSFLERLKKKTEAEIFLLYKEKLMLTTIEEDGLSFPSKIISEFKKGIPYLGKMTIEKKSYSIGSIPLEGATIVVGFSREPLMETLRGIRNVFFLLTIIGAFVALVLGSLMAKNITKPLHELLLGAKRIAQGNFDHLIKTERKDELGDFIQSFNQMAKELKDSRDALLRAERIAAWRDIARRVAHEIKNPLTPIQLCIQDLKRRFAWQKEDIKEITETILDEVESLRRIADEFSRFARMPELRLEVCDVNELIKRVATLYNDSQEGVEIITTLEKDLPPIKADKDKLREVFVNLIKNSIEACEGKGEIIISTSKKDGSIEVKVKDTGPGIKEEDIGRIFHPFFTTKTHGKGLGLSIVHKIIEEHGGGVKCVSKPGEGATFIITLPIEGKQ